MHDTASYLIILALQVFPLHGYNNAFQANFGDSLKTIHQITTADEGIGCLGREYQSVAIEIPTSPSYQSEQEKAQLAANLITDTDSLGNADLIQSTVQHLLAASSKIYEVRVVSLQPFWNAFARQEPTPLLGKWKFNFSNVTTSPGKEKSSSLPPWMLLRNNASSPGSISNESLHFMKANGSDELLWTFPYYVCSKRSWFLTYVAPITSRINRYLIGFLAFDINVTGLDINQCDGDVSNTANQILSFSSTHKCHPVSSQCVFEPGHGWIKGGYSCQCKKGYYSRTEASTFNGSLVEIAYEDKVNKNEPAYDLLYKCGKCQPGCESCIDDSPCLAQYNWTFRYILLTFSLACTLATFILSLMVYSYRKLKVFQLASPTFLCITLLGCGIMYLEMVAIFPYLDTYFCIATKWTRHLGFLLTYSSLLLKTWRVNLTYRVKSAHKLKLTDKQLLQWLFPILLVMIIYLSSWTLSDPPQAVYIEDADGLKFKQCSYGWWDHSLGIGNFLFLMWGIKVCFSVRKARTHYNEAKLITWSIYNIAIVNIIMVAIHLILFPHAGPDMKYFLGFLRTQLSTTVTIILVFGPKFIRLARGTANELDEKTKNRGNDASMIEIPMEGDEASQKDVYAENEELKEEIQKLAGQIQYLKIVGMLMENRHIKPKKDGYFSKENCSKQIHQFISKNGNVSTCSPHTTSHFLKFSCQANPIQAEMGHAKPTKSNGTSTGGHPVILAEKSEDKSYSIIEQTSQDLLAPDRIQPRGSTSSSTDEMIHYKYRAVSCETNSFREVSPSVEPFIPERV